MASGPGKFCKSVELKLKVYMKCMADSKEN